jgi:hypothetical protein
MSAIKPGRYTIYPMVNDGQLMSTAMNYPLAIGTSRFGAGMPFLQVRTNFWIFCKSVEHYLRSGKSTLTVWITPFCLSKPTPSLLGKRTHRVLMSPGIIRM